MQPKTLNGPGTAVSGQTESDRTVGRTDLQVVGTDWLTNGRTDRQNGRQLEMETYFLSKHSCRGEKNLV